MDKPMVPVSTARVLIFDLDGTLRDSREAITAAVRYALKRHLVEMPPWKTVIPHIHGLAAVHEHVAAHIPFEQLHASYDKKYGSLRHTITVYEEVPSILCELHEEGWLLAIASTSRSAQEWLQAHDLDTIFDVVVGGGDVVKRKPHPESLLLVLEKLNIAPDNAVMIGDLPADIIAGQAAGMVTIGITHGFGSQDSLHEAGATFIAHNLLEVLQIVRGL